MNRSIEVAGLSHGTAPIPVAARVGPLICSSGISGKDRSNGELPADGVAQVKNAFANLLAVLQAAGAGSRHLAKLTIYLKDDSLRAAINTEWLALFPDVTDRPARHILHYELQHGMLIQLEATAFVNE